MAPLAPGKLAAIKAQKAKEEAGKEMSSPSRVSPHLKKSKKKKDVGTSAGPRDTHKSPPRPPRSIRLTPPPTSSSALPADNWRVVLATNDYGGEQNSAWDLKFSGGNIVSQYTSSSDRERIGSLSYEEALEASRTYALRSSPIVTEVGKSFASDRAELQSSLTAAEFLWPMLNTKCVAWRPLLTSMRRGRGNTKKISRVLVKNVKLSVRSAPSSKRRRSLVS